MELFRNTSIRLRIFFTTLLSVLLPTLIFSYILVMKVEIDLKSCIFLGSLCVLCALILALSVSSSILTPMGRVRKKIRLFLDKRTVAPIKDKGSDEFHVISEEVDHLFSSWNHEMGNLLKTQSKDLDEKKLLSSAHSDLERQIQITRSCLSIAQRLNTTYDFHSNLKTILDEAVKTINIQWASILLINRENLEMTVACVRGIEQSLLDDLAEDKYPAIRLKPNEGLAGQVIKSGLPIIANKGYKDTRFKVYSEFKTREEKIGSILCAPIKGSEGTIYGVINFINRISPPLFRNEDLPFAEDICVLVSLVVERNRLFKSLFVDEATGMISHRVWKEYYNEEVARSVRYAHPLSVAVLDIDRNKEVISKTNPEFALKVCSEIGKVIRQALRDCDSASRVQDRFYLLLVDTDASGTLYFIGRIKDMVEKQNFEFSNQSFSVTLSAGISAYPSAGPDARKLLDFAQKALESAKSAGRNRAVIYSSDSKNS